MGFLKEESKAENIMTVRIKSSLDATLQPSILQAPSTYDSSKPTPLLVALHTWTGDYKQETERMGPEAEKREWILLLPNFRGPNTPNNPHAAIEKNIIWQLKN